MNKEQKTKEISNLIERLKRSKAMVFAGYRGLKVSEMSELRLKLRHADSQLKVVKNRLMKRALSSEGLEVVSKYFTGPTAVATSGNESVSPAKVLVEFAKAHDKLEVKGGFMEGKVLEAKDVMAISKLPSREELLARALASMNAPAVNLAMVLSAMSRRLVYAINAIKEKKQ